MGLDKMYWDNSMIVKAMDEAMLKYKIMHGHEVPCVSAEGGGVVNDCGKSDELKRSVDEESYNGENNVEFEVEETTSTLEAKENIGVELSIACTDFSDALHVEETQEEPVEDSDLEEYNHLLKQYYELEEKRQKVLEQLYQCGAGGWNYQDVNAGSDVGTQWGTSAANQEHPVSASQPSHYPEIPSYLPTGYPILAGPQSSSLVDDDIIKTAMDSATRAISSSLKTVNKGNVVVNFPSGYELYVFILSFLTLCLIHKALLLMSVITLKGMGLAFNLHALIPYDIFFFFGSVHIVKESDRHDEIMPQSGDSSETDLATVLNAWYSAGFYTGKYLMEQSHAKK
ncbi:uncharacterized protein LOC103490751 isoform X2 [Cucumis melo]|uniref:Uncharacterized protein LOC103490751 isoform X2 n=1 Tax=Cucumis melo TaxID=3656 RepID=A0ABM3KX48_CUCME|nr:uncharacterized protein LOC103490751 isoform X2 [Cucumis melo]